MQQAQFSQQQQIQQQQQQQQPQQQQQQLQTNLQPTMQNVQNSQYNQSPYIGVELPHLYLKKAKPFSQISTTATPQTNSSFAHQFPSPALLANANSINKNSSSNSACIQIQKLESTPTPQLFKQISTTPLLLSQTSQSASVPLVNLTPPKSHTKEQSKFKGNVKESDVKMKKKGSKSKKQEESAGTSKRVPIMQQVGRGKSQPITANYQIEQTAKQNFNIHRSPLTPNFLSNQLIEADLFSKKGNKSVKKGSPSNKNQNKNYQTMQAPAFSNNMQGGMIELALKNKSTQKKQSKNNFLDDKLQDDQKTLESKQSYLLNYEHQESVAQFLPSFNGMKTPFSQQFQSQKHIQQHQSVQQQQQQNMPPQIYQQIQTKYAEPQDYNLYQKTSYNNFQINPAHVSLQQYQLKQPNQFSQYQSIIPNYFESQQQFKEVNLLTSSVSSNSSGQMANQSENQQSTAQNSEKKLNAKNNSQIFNTINLQANKNLITSQNQSKKSNKKNSLAKSQTFYKNTNQQQQGIYNQNRLQNPQENYLYYLEQNNDKHEVKEEEDEEEEEEEEEDDDEEEEVIDQIKQQQQQFMHENNNNHQINKQNKWTHLFIGQTNKQSANKQIQQNIQHNQMQQTLQQSQIQQNLQHGQMQQNLQYNQALQNLQQSQIQSNLQPIQDQNLYSQYNSDDFQEEDEHENQLQNIRFYSEKNFPLYYDQHLYQLYQQGQNITINPNQNGNQVYEITEGEDDEDDDEEEEEEEEEDEEEETEEQENKQIIFMGNRQNDIYFRNNEQEEQEVSEEDQDEDDVDYDDESQSRVKNKINKNRLFEDDVENQFQSSDFDAQKNDMKMYNQAEYQQTRINMGSKNNLSVDKINSLTQVNTSNYDQMKSLISPKSRVSSYQQFSTLKFQKSNSNNNQMRSNTSLGEDGNNQIELEMDDEEDSHLTSFANNKNPSNIPNLVNKQTKFKKKSNTISSRGSYVSEQEQMQEGNKIMQKNPSQFLQTSQGIQQNQNFNLPVTIRNNSKKKSKTANFQPQHQILYQNFNKDAFQAGVEINNEYFQGNQVGSIIFAQQQQQVQFNNCNQYKFNIQNVNIQHPGNVSQIIDNQKILFKNNNQNENMKVNQSDINLQHQIKGFDQIYEVNDVNNSIIEKQVPEPPPPAGSQYSKHEIQQVNNIINYTHKNSFSSSASKVNTNQNSLKNLEQNNNNNNSKRGSFYTLQSASNNNNQIIDAKSKVKLMHLSSAEVTPQGSQLGNTPQKGIINLNNFTISPRLYGNDQINNTQITQSILFIPQQFNQLKRDQFFLEDQQDNLKSYLANKNKQQLKKKQSDDTTSITNHLSNSPNNNNNNNNTQNIQVQQKLQSQNKKSKKHKQSKSCVKICMSTVLLDNNTNNDDNKNTKQRVYSQQPYLEDPQIKKKWVLSRASKMQIDPRLANQLIEEINLYQHSKEVILEKLIQSILSYQTLKGKLKKKDNNNEVSVVQAAKNRTTQIFRSVSQLFTSTSNSNPSQQEIQQKMMQRMVNNGTQAAVATTLNNRTTTNDNQVTCEQEDCTRYEKDYIQENNSYEDEKKAYAKNTQVHNYKDIIQTTMATTTAAGQLSVYNNNSHIHSINNLPNSFISKKANYLKGTSNDKNNTINTLSSINNLPSASNQALKAISNVSYNNAVNHSTCPNSVNIISDNNIPGAIINGSICSSSNIQLVQQNSQQVSLFSPNQKDKTIRIKKSNKNINQFDMSNNQQQSIILEQDGQKHKKVNAPISYQQIGSDKQAQHKKKEISKHHNFNTKMMDLSSISVSIDPIHAIVTPKLPNNSKKSLISSQINANKESKSLEYKQNPQTISAYVQAVLPSQQSSKLAEFQINQREQSFSFNNQNICPICQHETQLFALNYKCEHKFCMYCIRQYIENKIYNNDVMKIFCPYKNCRFKLRSEHLKPYISQEMFDKFKALRKIVFKRMNPNVRYCTRADCDGYMIGDEEHPKLTCKKCFQEVCFHCCNNWHQGLRCDQAILEEETEDAQKEIGKQTCPMCNSKLNILQQIDGVQYSNKIMCSACNKPFCNLCRRQCGQFHFAPWNICYGCPGQKYSLEEPQCCEKFCIFLWGVMKLMMYIFLSVIGLALYPFIVAIVSLFMPLIIYAYFKGNRLQYSGFKKYLLLFSLFLLGIILYPVWLLITFIPGTCLFFKDMYQEKRLYGNEIDASQVNQ
ncbi:Ibr domain protein (macronuclear) [Tetrahymena thermophila SB210]|uniref:Ibr domain protein n=1 Tax=Tetrahymena thermophila (strain SB210) TaxID=312017 RepID=Q23GA0_TETTS|nr:Ibr domain protein [Tetrahymena thermophila SB210]EAR95360.3 Ibr domain protein [Tetrahymena thermophila SB210]|eukprot:XP_001015605.3 Ibr domain protein [Tetrahymena thermophila SB210]